MAVVTTNGDCVFSVCALENAFEDKPIGREIDAELIAAVTALELEWLSGETPR